VCILQTSAEECRSVSNSRRDQVDFRMDTGVSQSLRGGLTFSYVVNDQRHISQKLSQMIFSIYAEVNFRAGRLR
jgi:hypothetical protein